MEISKTEIGNALTSADENHILATANDIYDEEQQSYQSEINQSLKEGKQDKLVSGTNIKTINGNSLLGSGDVSIEGGGNFNESGTYPNLTAGKASKLATARKISLIGGAVSNTVNFDGSSHVNIPVTKIDESFIRWTTASKRAYGSITDNLMKNGQQNSFAFMPPNAVTVEYTNDSGATWLDYGLTDNEKTRFLTPLVGKKYLYVGKDGADLAETAQLRITLDFIEADMQLELRKIMLQTQMFSGSTNGEVRIKILSELYDNYNTDTWQEFIDETVVNPGWMSLPVTSINNSTWGYKGKGNLYPARLRVVFYRTGTPGYNTSLINIVGLSNFILKGNNIAKYCWPCTMDVSQNVTFPNAITTTKHITQGGTANQVVLGNGSLKSLDELSPITDADAEILLDNHIHSINVNTNGNDVNISVIESTKNGNNWETEEKNIPLPLASQDTAGIISAADKKKIDNINYEDKTLFVGDGMDGTLAIGHESSKASAEMRVFHDRQATIHTTSYNDTSGGSLAVMEAYGGKGRMEVNGDKLAELALSGAGTVRTTLTKKNEDGTKVKTIIDAEEGITAPKLATIGGTSEQILLGDGTLITFDELKAKLGLI